MEIVILRYLALPAVILVTCTALFLLVAHHWRWMVVALAVQYLGIFLLVLLSWPLEMSVVKLVTGWMAGATLSIAMLGTPQAGEAEESTWPSSRLFRLMAAGLVALAIASLGEDGILWLTGTRRLTAEQSWASLTLIGMGLLHLGLTTRPLRVVIGLLTVLSGFEILYASIETSALLAGLLAVMHLGLALAGAYLIAAPGMEETG